jgi:hypothetical protein
MAELFDCDSTVIERHINIIYNENELDKEATSANDAEVEKKLVESVQEI